MDLSTLQIFVEVARKGNFAAVARDRNLDPSSVSRAIAGLEDELGFRLFQRTTRQVSLTEAGTAYFERIEPLVETLDQAAQAAVDLTARPNGTLRVTASVAFGLTCIVPYLSDFSARYPDLTVDLVLTDATLDLLAERIDLAVRLGLLADSTLIAQRLFPTRYCVCASPGYLKQWGTPTQPGDIAHHNCLRFPLAGFRTRWIFKDQTGTLSEIPVQGRLLISNAIALQHCAIAGMGLALLPHWLVGNALREGALINLFPDYSVTATEFNTAAWLVYPSRTYIPLKVLAFIDFMKTTAHAHIEACAKKRQASEVSAP
ncbi:MAG: LysR family transcriptional regulator [Kaiparowitsia implicata GSE-PSE-MK54-09C]|jgi:DNA-binding transcriptional LysR family regulator|nr:LysR family transcriptional regulator [Kaiparowitsia implicata GSE-PSE-MK54-09C]